MGGRVELLLLAYAEATDVASVEEVVAGKVGPHSHAADAGFGDIDRLEPGAELVGMETAEPLTGRAAVAAASLGRG